MAPTLWAAFFQFFDRVGKEDETAAKDDQPGLDALDGFHGALDVDGELGFVVGEIRVLKTEQVPKRIGPGAGVGPVIARLGQNRVSPFRQGGEHESVGEGAR